MRCRVCLSRQVSFTIHGARHKLGQVEENSRAYRNSLSLELWWEPTMRGFRTSSFDPPTLVILEMAFDEAWLTLKAEGNRTVRPDELARSLLRLAMDGERDPVRLHDGALKGLLPAANWREAG